MMSWLSLTLVCLVALVIPGQADAYLDPGTGSAVIQMLVAGVMGALFVVRMYWRKIVSFFSGQPQEDEQASSGASAAVDERE